MLAKYILPKTLLLTIAAASLTGCLVGNSRAQGPAMVETGSVAAGEQCPYGGLRIESGNDADGNGSLDGEEVSSISYACNARVDGYTTLVDTSTTIPQGSCPEGGLLISTGKDTNENGQLDASEVEDKEVICDGDRGAAGACDIGEKPIGGGLHGGLLAGCGIAFRQAAGRSLRGPPQPAVYLQFSSVPPGI